MKRKRYIALALCVILIMTVIPVSVFAEKSDNGFDIEKEYKKLNNIQKNFIRVIGSLARKDYYETNVLASVTAAQGIYESGFARYGLPVGGKNLFGIKAYDTWDGRVFDGHESVLYENYDAFLVSKGESYLNTYSAWRAYDSWVESVKSHSSLFTDNDRYKDVIGEKDYKKAIHAIVDAGYCSDNGYAETVIELIQKYGLTKYDDLTPDSDGVIGIVSEKEQVWLNAGEEYQVNLYSYPPEKLPKSLVWKSENENIAAVDETGKIKAVSHGMTLVSAALENGREACIIVCVDCNSTVIESDVYVREEPTDTSLTKGKIYRGQPILVTDDRIIKDEAGNEYCSVKGYNSEGELVTGYSVKECIYRNIRDVKDIKTVAENVFLTVGQTYKPVIEISPIDALDPELSFESSDISVASVENGIIKANKVGNTYIKVSCKNGAVLKIKITVTDKEKEQRGIILGYKSALVRERPDRDSRGFARIEFLSEIKVIGAPDGVWLHISGVSDRGRTVDGYIHSAYCVIIPDGAKVERAFADGTSLVYENPDRDSLSYGALAQDTEFAFYSTGNEDWKFVIGLKNPDYLKSVCGYATPGISDRPVPEDPDFPDRYYGITTSDIHLREGKGTEFKSLGIIKDGTKVIITGDKDNGWYRVSAEVQKDGKTEKKSGYGFAEFIKLMYKGKTISRLKVRDKPTTEGNDLGTLDDDIEITVFGDATENGWYYVEGPEYGVSGSTLRGYSSAAYIKIIGVMEAEGESYLPKDPSLTVDKNGIIRGIKAETDVKTLAEKFSFEIKVTSPDGKNLEGSAIIPTGAVISVMEGDIKAAEYRAVIRGDVNGDGKIGSDDYTIIKRTFMGTHNLDSLYLDAAKVSDGKTLTIVDYVMIKRHVLGSYIL